MKYPPILRKVALRLFIVTLLLVCACSGTERKNEKPIESVVVNARVADLDCADVPGPSETIARDLYADNGCAEGNVYCVLMDGSGLRGDEEPENPLAGPKYTLKVFGPAVCDVEVNAQNVRSKIKLFRTRSYASMPWDKLIRSAKDSSASALKQMLDGGEIPSNKKQDVIEIAEMLKETPTETEIEARLAAMQKKYELRSSLEFLLIEGESTVLVAKRKTEDGWTRAFDKTVSVPSEMYYFDVGILFPVVRTVTVGTRTIAGTSESVATEESDWTIRPAVVLTVYPFGRWSGQSDFWRWIALDIGVDLDVNVAWDRIYGGLTLEPAPGLGLSGGVALVEMEELAKGYSDGTLLNVGEAPPKKETHNLTFFFGVRLSSELLTPLFSKEASTAQPQENSSDESDTDM